MSRPVLETERLLLRIFEPADLEPPYALYRDIDGIDEVELAFMIDKARWGEGFATEASLGIIEHARNALGLERLICLVMPGNERSVAVARKVGMKFQREYTDEYGLCSIYARSLLDR